MWMGRLGLIAGSENEGTHGPKADEIEEPNNGVAAALSFL